MSKERKRVYARKYRDACKKKLFEALGNKCQNCGIDNYLLLEIHHKIALMRRGNGGGGDMTSYLKQYKAGLELELLCANCHILADIQDGTTKRRAYDE